MAAEGSGGRGKNREIDERLAAALKQKQQLEARIAKMKAAQAAKDKRLEVRRIFIVGQAILTHRAAHGSAHAALEAILDEQVKKPADRAVIADLLTAA